MPKGGKEDGDGWKRQNAKGRVRPASSTAAASSERAPSGDIEARFREYFAAKCVEVGRTELVEEFFPPTPKTLKDEIMDAFAKVESAQSAHDHLAKQCVDMEAAFVRRQAELREYAEKLANTKAQHQQSKADLEQSRHKLVQLRQQDEQGVQPVVPAAAPTIESAKSVLDSYDPTAAVTRALQVPEMQGLDVNIAAAIGRAMHTVLCGEARSVAEQIFVTQTVPTVASACAATAPPSASALPPPQMPPPQGRVDVSGASNTAGVSSDAAGGAPGVDAGAVDGQMDIPGKRGAEEALLDLGDGSDSDAELTPEQRAEKVIERAKAASAGLPTRSSKARGAAKAKSS